MYDTYEGMSTPTPADVLLGKDQAKAADMLVSSNKSASIWGVASLEDVKAKVTMSKYPQDRFRFVQGKVENTIPRTIPERIALLRLDTDWYESTKHEMEHLFPCLVPGGFLICDDYGFWAGARKAVDEYLNDNKIRINLYLADAKVGSVIEVKQDPTDPAP